MLKELENCTICPHQCGANRNKGQLGRCKAKDTVKIALYSIHFLKNHVLVVKKVLVLYFFLIVI